MSYVHDKKNFLIELNIESELHLQIENFNLKSSKALN